MRYFAPRIEMEHIITLLRKEGFSIYKIRSKGMTAGVGVGFALPCQVL